MQTPTYLPRNQLGHEPASPVEPYPHILIVMENDVVLATLYEQLGDQMPRPYHPHPEIDLMLQIVMHRK
ncbi:hypothetical protein ACHAWC_010390 [Mediolabrus comicus]